MGTTVPAPTVHVAAGTTGGPLFTPAVESRGRPVAEVLGDLKTPALPPGTTATAMFALIRLDEPDGGEGWSVRVTEGLDDAELLGVLVGYVEHLKRAAAESWDESDPTR